MRHFIFYSVLLFAFLQAVNVKSQSVHQAQDTYYSAFGFETEEQWDEFNGYQSRIVTWSHEKCNLNYRVFGWHPYWMGSAYNDYDFSLLSDVAYFSYSVDVNTGGYTDIHDWLTTDLVTEAQAAGTKVHLAVTMFSGHGTLFENATSSQNLIDNLIDMVQARDADGINIDFEKVPSSQSENLTAFMIDLSTQFHAEIPDGTVSMALPAVDWSETFQVDVLKHYVDLFIIMGYDFHWSSAPNAGPVSPKNNGALWSPYDVTRSVNYYLEAGVPPQQLTLAVAYYGYDWPTESNSLNSETTGSGTVRIYSDAIEAADTYGYLWDEHSATPYYMYQSGQQWHQCWFDDEYSLGYKYDMVKMQDIAGIGIWALGYDQGKTALWDVLEEKLSDCGNTACNGFFADMGGSHGNYFDNEDYVFTIAPQGADSVIVNFQNVEIEANYDTLFVYDGEMAEDNLLGFYTGNYDDFQLVAKSGVLTFRFYSDYATTEAGWRAFWSCSNGAVGQQDVSLVVPVVVAPNPVEDVLQITLNYAQKELTTIELYNLNGKKLHVQTIKPSANQPCRINMESFQQGVYLLKIQSATFSYQRKIVKH